MNAAERHRITKWAVRASDAELAARWRELDHAGDTTPDIRASNDLLELRQIVEIEIVKRFVEQHAEAAA